MWEGILTETPHCLVLTRGPSSPMSAWIYHDLDGYCGDDDDDDVVNKGKEDDDEDDVASNPPNRLVCLSWTFASGAAQTAARLLSRHLPSIESESNIIVVKWKKAGNIGSNHISHLFLLASRCHGIIVLPPPPGLMQKRAANISASINNIGNGVKVNFNMKISTNLAS